MAARSSGRCVCGNPDRLCTSNAWFANLSVSPDGDWLLFKTMHAREDVFVMRADGSQRPANLTDDPYQDRWPAWYTGDHPDGPLVTFAIYLQQGYLVIVLSNFDGSAARNVSLHVKEVLGIRATDR